MRKVMKTSGRALPCSNVWPLVCNVDTGHASQISTQRPHPELFAPDPRPWRHALSFFHLNHVVVGIAIDEFVEGINSRLSGALVNG